MTQAAELVFIPAPGIGHLISMVEMAKLLILRDHRLSITILIMNPPVDNSKLQSYTQSLPNSADSVTAHIRFIHLPSITFNATAPNYFTLFIESNKPLVRDALADLCANADASPCRYFAGFILDMFCTTMIDVADELGVPSYVFFTSSVAFLGLMLHLQALQDDHKVDIAGFKDYPDAELDFPCFVNPLPAKVLPSIVLIKEMTESFLTHAKRLRRTKGVFVNTFAELELRSLESLAVLGAPPFYTVGPILNLTGENLQSRSSEIMEWLDDQPPSAVVFLCFGSMGSLSEKQVKEIACALEQSGHRFLWSLRKPPPKGKVEYPGDYENPTDVLPEGFSDRTAGVGKVIGWAPQAAVLAHPAIGGFISHCGWNSTLESIWFGVPMATWPLFAEQQFNAFEMVVELGLAVEMKIDYRRDARMGSEEEVLKAEDIERGVRKLMEEGEERKKMKEMSMRSREALSEGGSSYVAIGRLIEVFLHNMH